MAEILKKKIKTPARSSEVANNPLMKFQGYLYPAEKGGVDAIYAWKFKGGDGKGKVKFVVIEQGWIPDHEDIQVKTFPGTGINDPETSNHGAAVMGVIMMKNNGVGGIGITPDVDGYIVSEWRPEGVPNLAAAITYAITQLHYGDIILIESQVTDISPPYKLWPVETAEDIFLAIKLATEKGIIVIEPAGNGTINTHKGNDLDSYSDDGEKKLNPESSDFKDSGAIIVSAASARLPHKRITSSNYGKRVNCYAWGNGVATAGSYPGSSNGAINSYTKKFEGTSSAAAIIAGVAIAVQGIAEANLHTRLGPLQMRAMLSNDLYATASLNGRELDKIAVMPDLKKIIENGLKIKSFNIA